MVNRTKETLQKELQKVISAEPQCSEHSASIQPDLEAKGVSELSALQELSYKIELCLERQKKLRFITKEISEIIKKSS